MNSITFVPLQSEDIDTLLPLAHHIWHAHYPGIITTQQIDYMLARGYTHEVIHNEIQLQGIIWIIIRDSSTMIGFISVGPYGDGCMKLHKLYLLPEYHGKGIGSLSLAEVELVAKHHNASTIVLNVNKDNQKAICAYQHAGWNVSDEAIIDIGNGYVMNDYIMTKQLT